MYVITIIASLFVVTQSSVRYVGAPLINISFIMVHSYRLFLEGSRLYIKCIVGHNQYSAVAVGYGRYTVATQ